MKIDCNSSNLLYDISMYLPLVFSHIERFPSYASTADRTSEYQVHLVFAFGPGLGGQYPNLIVISQNLSNIIYQKEETYLVPSTVLFDM